MRKVPKTSFLGHFGPFLTVFRKMTENDGKYQKSAWYIFLLLNVPYFMQSFRKILGAVSEKLPEQTDRLTERGDSIGPFGLQPGTNKNVITRARLGL